MRRKIGSHERRSAALAERRMHKMGSSVNELFQKAVKNEEIMRRYQRFELMLLDVVGFEPLLDMLLRNAVDYFQLDCVELWLYDPQDTLAELLPEDYLGTPGLHFFSNTAPMVKLYGRNPSVRLVATGERKALPVFVGKELKSAALIPLVRHGVLVGSLHFGSGGHQRFTLDKSTDFIDHLASIVSVCLENAVNQERLHRLSMYDVLTKVKNRRAFHQALDEEVSRAARGGDPLSVLFVDLDYFKQINDTYGHQVGDKVLRTVAQHIDGMLRKTDHVCRYGGEEFALVLPNCGQERAKEIAERIRFQVSELLIDNEEVEETGVAQISVTLSIGVCCWIPQPETDQGAEEDIGRELVACSDQGVYMSKAAGRNCIHTVDMENFGSEQESLARLKGV